MDKLYYNFKLLSCFFLTALLIVSCAVIEPEQQKPGNPYFWKVEKAGNVSYLLGTMHIAVSLYHLPCSDTIVEKLENSDLVFVEVLPENTKEKSTQNALSLLSPNDEDFRQLSPDDQLFLGRKGINSRLNYLGISTSLELMCTQEVVGPSALSISMDSEVITVAQSYNIPLKSLDTSDLLAPISTAFTRENVEEQIKNYLGCLEHRQAWINSYKEGIMSISPADTTDEFDTLLFKNRNEKWLVKFKSAYNDYDRIFVAAGALHFIGSFNLVDSLKSEGFSVERVSCQ